MNLDTLKPYTIKEFKQYNRDIVNVDVLSKLYNSYLTDWKETRVTLATNDSNYKSTIYKEFLKNIDITSLDQDIISYLDAIDYEDEYELDLATHYFSIVLRQEIVRLIDYRDDIKFTVPRNNLKSSPEGITKYLKAHIMRLLSQDKFKKLAGVKSFNTSEISNKIKITLDQHASNVITGTEAPYNINSLNKNNLNKSIERLSRTTLQSLKVTTKGQKKYLKTSFNTKLSINQLYSNWDRLPDRFFTGEQKSFDNLVLNVRDKLKEKYLGTDVYYLSGNSTDYSLSKIFEAENYNAYLYNHYNPIVVNDYGNIVKKDSLARQLSFGNSGLAISLSKNLTFNIDVSATNRDYIIPDPKRLQPGVGLSYRKRYAPINYNSSTSWIKDNNVNSINVNDTSALKGTGYQSKENSLQYSSVGINKIDDEFSFWSGPFQIDWKNEDVYERSYLNRYPEEQRYNNLLIKNDVATQIRTDIYGNEFILYKPTSPKRYGGSSYILSETITIGDTTVCELYDGLYFNGVLSAISAADPTAYDSLTAIYDTLLFNDNSGCNATIDTTSFYGPLSTADCSAVSGDDLVDGGPLLNHPCKSTDFIQDMYIKPVVPFSGIAISSPYTTVYELSTLNNPITSRSALYDETYTTPGSAFVRDVYTQKVYTLYERLSGVLSKLPVSAVSAVSANEITNLDIIGDTLYLQTSANTFVEKYSYNKNGFTIARSSQAFIDRYDVIDFFN